MLPISKYPLTWPRGRTRTSAAERVRARFDTTFGRARDALFTELKRLGAADVVLSTNVELRHDGIPYSKRREPDDPAIAAYFNYKGRAVCFACDRWDRVHDNLHAVYKTIEALRGIARWGTGDMIDSAFSGFEALPAAGKKSWAAVLNVRATAGPHEVKDAYNQLTMLHHPDRGGDTAKMVEINLAYEEFKKERGLCHPTTFRRSPKRWTV